MISYNGGNDEHSTSVCGSFSYSAGDTDSSAGFTDPLTPNTRRAKLSYMGYVPVSPNTAAALELMEKRDHSHTHRTRNSNGDIISDTVNNSSSNNNNANNNNNGHTNGETITATGSTFPPIKVDDTSTSRRRLREFDDDSKAEQQQPSSVNKTIMEHITVGQQRYMESQKLKKEQDQKQLQEQSSNIDADTVADHTLTSRVEDGTIATSVASSVMPNSCTGHPAMTTKNQRHLYQQQQDGQYRKNTKQEFHPLSPVIASPNPSTSIGGQEAWNDNASLGLSPLTAGVSAYGMVPPSLNHPSAMMQSHWNPNLSQYQQHHHDQLSQPVQNNANPNLPQMYPYSANGNPSHQPQQQQPQGFQSGFFPRNPVLARQLQAFHQYHKQEQPTEQPTEQPSPTSPFHMSHAPEVPQVRHPHGSHPAEAQRAHHNFESEGLKKKGGMPSSQQSSTDNSSSDDPPFSICGPDGPRLMDNVNVKFVTPARKNGSSRSLSSPYSGALGGVACVQYPAGQKCQTMLTGFLNTCGAIVSHGYHTDNSKSYSKEKRAKFGKVADESIARLIQTSDHGRGEEGRKEDNNYYDLSEIGSGLNDAFAANAKMIIHAGNNIFDTFQKYAPVTSPMHSDASAGFSRRVAKSDDQDEVVAAVNKEQAAPLSPVNAQREHFRKLRRRRNRGSESPIRRSANEPHPALSPNSTGSKEKGSEKSLKSLKDRYSRNLHTKLHSEKLEKGGVDDKREPEESKDPDGSKDEDESDDSWATPNSREESNAENFVSVIKHDHPSGEPRSRGDKPTSADTEEVVSSTSSGMSESLVGSDVEEEEDSQLDILNSALSEDERQQEELTDGEEEEHLLLDSYDHNDFPYTPLDVIEEGSEDDDTTIKNSRSKDFSIATEAPMDGQEVDTISSDDVSIEGCSGITHVRGRTSNVIGFIRIVFFSMLFLHCGTIVCLWDQFADQIRTMEGGPAAALSAAEDVVTNLKASGVSLVTTAKGIINVNAIDISVGEILFEIESRTTALMGTANKLLAELAADNAIKKQEAENDKMQMLFHQLVDDALLSDDDFLPGDDIISVVE